MPSIQQSTRRALRVKVRASRSDGSPFTKTSLAARVESRRDPGARKRVQARRRRDLNTQRRFVAMQLRREVDEIERLLESGRIENDEAVKRRKAARQRCAQAMP